MDIIFSCALHSNETILPSPQLSPLDAYAKLEQMPCQRLQQLFDLARVKSKTHEVSESNNHCLLRDPFTSYRAAAAAPEGKAQIADLFSFLLIGKLL